MTKNALPVSIDDLLELMEEYAWYWRENWQFWPVGTRSPELSSFKKKFFAAHKAYYLAEMIPFVKYDHRLWPVVVAAVFELLQGQQVIHPDHRCAGLLQKAPDVWLPDEYVVR